VTAKFNNRDIFNYSIRSIRRRPFDSGFKRRPVSKKITLGPFNREKLLRFCRSKVNWSVENDWAKIIFSDETKVEVGADKNIYVWRKKDEWLHSDCVSVVPNKDRNVKFSTMFWGCITYFGVGTLTPVVGNINSEKYISILDDNLYIACCCQAFCK